MYIMRRYSCLIYIKTLICNKNMQCSVLSYFKDLNFFNMYNRYTCVSKIFYLLHNTWTETSCSRSHSSTCVRYNCNVCLNLRSHQSISKLPCLKSKMAYKLKKTRRYLFCGNRTCIQQNIYQHNFSLISIDLWCLLGVYGFWNQSSCYKRAFTLSVLQCQTLVLIWDLIYFNTILEENI